MDEFKAFGVHFFVGQVGANDEAGHLKDMLQSIIDDQLVTVSTYGSMTYEIRDLESHSNGATYTGVLAKFRTDDFPHVGEPGGEEEELNIGDNQGLIEKNHFIFHRQNQLLVWQVNGNASSEKRLGEVLSDISNETVVFNPVFQPDAVRRLMRGNVTPLSLEFTIARPTNTDLIPRNQWNEGLLSLMGQAGGARFSAKITSDSRSAEGDKRKLMPRMKSALKELSGMDGVTKAKFIVEEDGIKHPLDLLEDRVKSSQTVEMIGRYPSVRSMYSALRRAKTEQQAALDEYFGQDGNALI